MSELETRTVNLAINILKPKDLEVTQSELEIILAKTVEYFRQEFESVLQQKKQNQKLN